MRILNYIIAQGKQVRERLFRRFRDRVYPPTFREEINEQCDIFFPLYAPPFFVAWLPYLAFDPLIVPSQPLMPILRIGLTVVGVTALILRNIWQNPGRHRLIGNSMMYYMIIATGIITGLAKAHPSYVGGYCFLITVLGAMPVQPFHLFTALGLSLSVFAGLCVHYDVSFIEPAARYSLQDLISTVSVSVAMSIGWTILRQNSYEKGRALQLVNAKITAQQDLLTAQNQDLQQLNREKDEIIGIVSHDLRGPLASIIGMAEVLREDDKQLQPERRMEMVRHIHNGGLQMRVIIDHLLHANAIENGVLKPNLENIDVSAVVSKVVRDNSIYAAQKDILLISEIDENTQTQGDALFVRQIVENLLSNAIKYSPPKKQVFVRVQRLNGAVQIQIKDEGPGLSSEDYSRLFTKFGRLSAKPTAGEQSVGLGLSIVKKMVESMNGKVWCESELGKGAVFIVELPRK